jgi:hypothetical protein
VTAQGISATGALLAGTAAMSARRTANPIRYIRWLPNQWSFLSSVSLCKQIRHGNQWGGKTTAALSEVIGRCIGEHPLPGHRYDVTPGPGFESWVICDSWSQAVAIMGKLWALLPKDRLHPDTYYDPRSGFRGKNPLVQFSNGAIIRIKTANQDPKSLASGTIDVALFDEPPPTMRIYTEVMSRLQSKGGALLLAYTPVNAPVEYLRQLVADGKIEDHWCPLTPQALIPVGHTKPMRGQDGQVRDEAWIAALRLQVPPDQAPVVIDGEWEFRARGAYFEGAWDQSSMVHARTPHPAARWHLGIDHGTLPGKQIALLMAVIDTATGPAVFVVDEYVDALGTATPRVDARGIVDMLRRNGRTWTPQSLACAYGDRTHMPGREEQKSNKDLALHILRELAQTTRLDPPLLTAKRGAGRGAGAVDTGGRWLRTAMIEGRFAVHPRCRRLLESLPKYNGTDDGNKDAVDAVRYGCDMLIFAGVPRGPVATLAFR